MVFIDGTGQTGEDINKATNIWKLYRRAVTNAQTQPIIPFYHEGIGTSWWNYIRGQTTGNGIDRHIRKAYQFLVETYQPGDKIFIFGFSRGAYTARALNGMIEFVGLLDKRSVGKLNTDKIINKLFDFYHQTNDGIPEFEKRLRLYIQN